VSWYFAELTAVQNKGIAKSIADTGYNLYLEFICQIMQQARIEIITEWNGGMCGNISVIQNGKKHYHSGVWILC
jgi:hypothetical protein